MITDVRIFSSSESKTGFICSNVQSMWIPLVPMFAGLLILLICFQSETSVVYNISATRLALNTCCLQWELCTVVESDQNCNNSSFLCYLIICSFSLTAMTVACNSNRGIENCLVGTTLHFPITYAKSIQ